jgi:hypoxanthine phosphoribosyltransferase
MLAFDITSLVLGIIGLGLGIPGVLALTGWHLEIKRQMAWGTVARESLRLGETIKSSGFDPQVLVFIEGGGLFVGGLVLTNCDQFTQRPVTDVCVVSRRFQGRQDQLSLSPADEARVKGKRVLIFDSIAYSGQVAIAAKDLVTKAGAAEVKTAATYRTKAAGPTLDYSEREVGNRLMPWARTAFYKARYHRQSARA